MVRKSFHTVVEGSVNSLATNKDANHVVVAGRNVLKMFEIRDDLNMFVEKINLRVGKNQFNYNTNDISWSWLDENLLATAATNGMIYIWNVERNTRGKVETIFTDHRRTVNKICFHPSEVTLLLSGSQDGTMKLFDLRKKEVVTTFHSMSESVRDVQFSTFRESVFSAVQENGNVQIWDLRKNDKPERQFTAHNGPIYACDWHPEDRKWFATAGRDNTIKVWDLSKKPNCCYCIQTMASVARVVWRPNRRNNIASSSLNVDFSVYVWDIDRPFVPFAAFTEHSDITTAILWRNDPHTLISAGKDAILYQHSFKEAQRPASHANNIGLDLNIQGDVALAISDYIVSKSSKDTNSSTGSGGSGGGGNNGGDSKSETSSTKHVPKEPAIIQMGNSTFFPNKMNPFKKNSDLTEKFKCSSSSLRIFGNTNVEKCLSMEWFVSTALRYKLFGKPFTELCDHNAEVSKELNRSQVSQTWKILRLLYSSTKMAQNSGSSEVRPFDLSSSSVLDRPLGESKSRHVSKGTNSGGGETRSGSGTENRVPSTSSINSLLLNPIGGSRLFNTGDSTSSSTTILTPTTTTTTATTINPIDLSTENIIKTPVNCDTSDHININLKPSTITTTIDSSPSGIIDDQSGFYFESEDLSNSVTNFTTDFELTPTTSTLFGGLDGNHLFTESFRTINDSYLLPDSFLNSSHHSAHSFHNQHHSSNHQQSNNNHLLHHQPFHTQLASHLHPHSHPSHLLHPHQQHYLHEPGGIGLGGLSDYDDNDSLDGISKETHHRLSLEDDPIDDPTKYLLTSNLPPLPTWKFTDLVIEMLQDYANKGDIQTTVSMMIVLGERVKNSLDESIQEFWVHSYIELLSRFQLWNVVNQIIRACNVPNINSINQTSTTIYTSCGKCQKGSASKVGWLCDKCKSLPSQCSICHEIVKGLYIWCQGCSHGGHLQHITEWLKISRHCPSGCGHQCEYT
ncbi:GATOR complex protein WDR24-like isoform X2 [Panonychus citri]|uniref:GATOR complex protein WDR24-like isoform X2 n=1 Tax=Panonychus citri TaxID=50023 RepID=UPI002306F8C8|nr:GATOR complex protein WDR24-like isoform X2 [Panonychus citri]